MLADDILLSDGSGAFSIFREGVTSIGLRPNDDIDALALDVGANIALFSLSPFSPSTFTFTGDQYLPCSPGALSPADICIAFFTGEYFPFASAGDIGLRLDDNVDALDTVSAPPTILLVVLGCMLAASSSLVRGGKQPKG